MGVGGFAGRGGVDVLRGLGSGVVVVRLSLVRRRTVQALAGPLCLPPDGGVSWERVSSKLRGHGVYKRDGIPTQLALDPDICAEVVAMFRPLKAR